MPLYLTEEIKDVGLFSIWKLTESEEELLQLITLSQEEKYHFATLKNNKRKKEWLTNRIVLNHLLGKDFSIDYLPNGKPILKIPSFFLSISHSNDFVVVFVSKDKETGVDIEKIRENIASLKHKFLLPEELQSLDTSNPFLLHVYWGAKEAIYKMYSSYHPLFTEHLSLSCVDCQKGTATGKIMKEDFHKTVSIIFRQIEDNLLVCCFEN
ncbi:MAG: 4'-phosphopantetheinyl transferase superfamily protein [Bacteroidales bacterium]|jgi:4'-phosphopantetheinyl transferase EntD|nr:4'-phosphopantetheinyl transferase superfamily protein [Bacteroidales bacterium]